MERKFTGFQFAFIDEIMKGVLYLLSRIVTRQSERVDVLTEMVKCCPD